MQVAATVGKFEKLADFLEAQNVTQYDEVSATELYDLFNPGDPSFLGGTSCGATVLLLGLDGAAPDVH